MQPSDVLPHLLDYQCAWFDDAPLQVVCSSPMTGQVMATAARAITAQTDVHYFAASDAGAVEFIDACWAWVERLAASVPRAREVGQPKAGTWLTGEDGSKIASHRIVLPTGHVIIACAGPTRPRQLRGPAWIVIADADLQHADLLSWSQWCTSCLTRGGRVTLLATSRGRGTDLGHVAAAARAGWWGGVEHVTTFADALAQGRYKQICAAMGEEWSQEAEDAWADQVRADAGSSWPERFELA